MRLSVYLSAVCLSVCLAQRWIVIRVQCWEVSKLQVSRCVFLIQKNYLVSCI